MRSARLRDFHWDAAAETFFAHGRHRVVVPSGALGLPQTTQRPAARRVWDRVTGGHCGGYRVRGADGKGDAGLDAVAVRLNRQRD